MTQSIKTTLEPYVTALQEPGYYDSLGNRVAIVDTTTEALSNNNINEHMSIGSADQDEMMWKSVSISNRWLKRNTYTSGVVEEVVGVNYQIFVTDFGKNFVTRIGSYEFNGETDDMFGFLESIIDHAIELGNFLKTQGKVDDSIEGDTVN